MKPKIYIPLQIKVSVVVFLLLFFANIVLGLYILNLFKNNYREISERYTKNLALISNAYIENVMLTGESELLKALVENIVLEKHMLGIHIFDTNGELYCCGKANIGANLLQEYRKAVKPRDMKERFIENKLSKNVNFYSYYKPLFNKRECKVCHVNDGKIIGLLNINVDNTRFFSLFRKKTAILLWSLILFSFILSLIIIYIMKYIITHPIGKLEKAITKVTEGDLDSRAIIKSRDEIEKLSDCFNKMVESLKNTTYTLNKMYKNVMHTDRLMTVGQIAAVMSHEVKNPINSILVQTDLLKSNINNLDLKDILSKLDYIVDDCVKANKIIDYTLKFTRYMPEAGEVIEISGFLKDLDLFVRRLFLDSSNIAFEIVDKRKEFNKKIYFNRVHLEQVFINIIKNAYDAVSEKGMGKIHLIVSDSEEFVIFDIEDNGVGISEEKIKHIFDEFYTTKQSGSGIGLSIVKHILELYNAEISVKSKLNVGTTFTVKIPVYDEKD